MTTLGFIGAGNMAGAIIRGILRSQAATPAEIAFYSPDPTAAEFAAETGATLTASNSELVQGAEVVVLGVKPQVLPLVAAEIFDAVATSQPLVVSIAAGVSLEQLEAMFPVGTRIVRTMPNLAAQVGEAMTAVTGGSNATAADVAQVRELLNAVGRTVELPEKNFSAFVALAGSSPAFILTFVEALSRGGVLGGIPKAQATEIVLQAVLGTAKTAQAQAEMGTAGMSPAALIDAVCSPGGTTIAGLTAMEKAGFSSAVVQAFEATVARDQELGK